MEQETQELLQRIDLLGAKADRLWASIQNPPELEALNSIAGSLAALNHNMMAYGNVGLLTFLICWGLTLVFRILFDARGPRR